MPIDKGIRGKVNPISSPLGRGGYQSRSFDGQSGGFGAPGLGFRSAITQETRNLGAAGVPFRSPDFSTLSTYVVGNTLDADGAALASCVVKLFRAFDDALVCQGVSDGAGAYSLCTSGSGPYYVVAYKADSPDVMGTTVNTLQPTIQSG